MLKTSSVKSQVSGNSAGKTDWPADRIERWSIGRLVPYARNARTHTDAQVGQIAASIREWGWTNPVLVEALADMSSDPEKRKLHLLIGGGLATGVIKTRLLAQADRIVLSLDVEKRVRESVKEFERTAIETFGPKDKERLAQPLANPL